MYLLKRTGGFLRRGFVHARKSDATACEPLRGSGFDERPSASEPRTGSKILDYHGLSSGVLVLGRIGTGAGAGVRPLDASGNATCPAGTYTSPINNSANITLQPGVNVVIPAGPGGVNAVNLANTGGVSPGNGGPDITISADGTLGGITIN